VTALSLAASFPDRIAAVVCIDGAFARMWQTMSRVDLVKLLTPPRIEVPPHELRAMLRRTLPFWSPQVEAAVLPGFRIGDDGLARARLPFEQHMQVVDAILDSEQEAVYDQVRCPAWLVSAEPASDAGRGRAFVEARATALGLAAERLARPRLFRWAGAVHDVPLQWPALVAGLIRAAVDECIEGGRG
jgi:pimeloyl-ACP methyl ester carboxylesterase